ncbi:MAG: S-layer homology domain-containing protein [Clostridia bacterium]|nr:S-layer homology domain-containing protein [Clostridia bacterium]
MKKLLSLLLAVIMTACALAASLPASAASFIDVKPGRWSEEYINYAVKAGYLKGVGGNRFDPSGTTTRAMVVTVLWRIEGEPDTAFRSDFKDVPGNKWYSVPVIWAKDSGVVTGVSADRFNPDGPITREQLAAMLFRYSTYKGYSVSGRADLSGYSDGTKISGWAADAFAWAVSAGLINGVTDKTLVPGGPATREQLAAILKRFDENVKLAYNEPAPLSTFAEAEYPLVKNADFYVSTAGSDENDGSFEHPFATFGKAIEAARGVEKTAAKGSVTVAFMAGEYGALSVSLTAADSGTADCPVIFCKYGDGDVVFNNGFDVASSELKEISADEKSLFPAKSADKIKKTDVSDRLTNYDPASLMVTGDDGDCTLARYPNKFPDGTDDLMKGCGYTISETQIRISLSHFKNRIVKYHAPEELYLYGYLTTGWYKDLLETGGYTVDPETGDFDFLITHPESARMGSLRYPEFDSAFWNKTALVNASEELDAAGEYWIDKNTGTFYVFSPSGDYHFTGGADMITIYGTEYLTFRGLDFKNATGYMIKADGHPRGMTIDGCTFSGCTAESMVSIEGGKMSVPFDVTVKNSTFSTCAAEGLRIRGQNSTDKFGTGTGVVVDNNLFTLTNLRIGNMGALKVEVSGPLVSHNVFKKCFWEGIDFRGASNMIAEYNVLDEVCYNGDDTGAMNNWNSVDCCGNIVRYNLFMNIGGGTNGRNSLYLDDTAGTTVESNIFYNVDCTALNNGISKYNVFKNNVIIQPRENYGTGCAYRTEATLITEENMAAGTPDGILSTEFYKRWKNAFEYFDSHPDVKAQAAEMWPGYFDISLDLDDWQKPEFCMNSSLVITGNVEINRAGAVGEYDETISKYSTIENNVGYTTAENPMFVNPTAGDYSLREGVDFPDYHFEKIGRYPVPAPEPEPEPEPLVYNPPVIVSRYTEKDYPLVTDADFYVSTTGSDSNDGSLAHPFRTMNKAVEAVRAIPKTAEKGGVKVAFMAGEYGTLRVSMTAEDSGTPECPVIYCKYGDGDVVFNNGIDLTPDSFSDLDESDRALFNNKAADKIKKCDISSLFDKGLDKDTLFVFSDDWICTVARYPNKHEDGADQLFASGETFSSTALQITHPMLVRRLASYSPETVAKMKIYGYIIRGYRKDTFKAASFDPNTGVLEIANWETSEFGVMRSGWRGADGNGIKLCILDVPYELDAKDEYWVDDETGTIYFFNPNGEYHIPAEGTMISMDHTDDITFRGLSFRNTTGQFIGAEMSHGITIDLCEFKGVSSTAGVRIYNCSKERSFDIAITNSEFSCAYGASAYVNGRCADADRYTKHANVLFDNNLVRSSNLVYDVENAVDFPYNNDLTVTHNSFVHSSRGAVSFSKSYNVLIEYNDFDSVMINSEDGGAVYSNGNVDGRHIKVCHNFFNYMPPDGTGTFGYYVDDNTAGVDIYENLFYYAACPVMLHLGRDNVVHDNVFIDKVGAVLSNGHRSVFEAEGIEQGLKDGDVRKALKAYTTLFENIDKYPEYRAGVEIWSPEVLDYHFDYDNMDDPNFVFNPVNTIVDNVYINNTGAVDELTDKYQIKYVTIGGLRGYTLDENPFFVNPTAGDYRIKAGADIKDIQFEKIGRY